jgi:hypothetical protein
MKSKSFLFIILVFAGISLKAENVTVKQAEKVAMNFYFERHNMFQGEIPREMISIQSVHTEKDAQQTYYYVFHFNPAGFVIVPADDCLVPVLGYSFEHNYVSENQPPNVQWWFQQYADQVKFARENLLQPEAEVTRLWQHYLAGDFAPPAKGVSGKAVEPLLTTTWHQNWPYNYYSPPDPAGPGGHALAGCVATAYSQLLYYWRYPLHGSGYHCYTPTSNPQYGEQCADFENTWYRWNEMCDAPGGVNTAIAELLYHVGVAVEMNFGPSASGAAGYPEQMEPWFNLSTDYDSLRRAYYTDEEWVNIIVDQLNQKYPIGYTGFTSNMSTGHMWVCDGYQDSTYFHMNWGWGGSSNGYYTLNNLQGFNTFQYIGINFYPDMINYVYPNYAAGADTLNAFEGSIEDGSGPIHNYLNDTYASWLIDPQTEYDSVSNIIIMVKRLEIFEDGDVLNIYDGEDNTAPLLAALSGNTLPGNITSTGNKLFIEFITDSENTADGFYLNYKITLPVWCSGMTSLTTPAAVFDDGSGTFYYYNGTMCQWFIDPGTAEPLTLHFNYFETEENHDLLKIYDYTTQALLAELSGVYEIPPEPVTSPGGKFYLVFSTNNNIRAKGWEAWYDITSRISDPEAGLGLHIYPNPSEAGFTVSFQLENEQQVIIEMHDLTGRKLNVFTNEIFARGPQRVSLNADHLPPGLYFLRLHTGERTVTQKIIKY